jgi:hypothetical protein
LENLRRGRESAHQRMKNLQVETKELKQYREKEAEPQEYNYESDSSDDDVILKRYSKKKQPMEQHTTEPVAPPKKGRTREPIDLEEKRLKYEAKLLEKEYQMKLKNMESAHQSEPKPIAKPVLPTKPKPIVMIG